MSSLEPADTFSFSIPDSEPVEVYLIRLETGAVVARTLAELEIPEISLPSPKIPGNPG